MIKIATCQLISIFFWTVSDVPGPPKTLSVTSVSEKNVGLKWEEPESDGGCDITGYIIEMREASRRTWQKAGSVEADKKREYLVSPLIEGQQYIFRVAAENEVGVGEWTELTQSVTAKTTHG